MWRVIYVAPNQAVADMVKGMLTNEGFLVTLRTAGVPHFGAAGPFEVLVPAVEAEEAHTVLQERFSPRPGRWRDG